MARSITFPTYSWQFALRRPIYVYHRLPTDEVTAVLAPTRATALQVGVNSWAGRYPPPNRYRSGCRYQGLPSCARAESGNLCDGRHRSVSMAEARGRQAAAQGTGRSRSHVRAKDVGQCSPANRIGTPADSSGNP